MPAVTTGASDGQRVAIFYSKVHNRGSCGHLSLPAAPQPLRRALREIDRHVADYISEARMSA